MRGISVLLLAALLLCPVSSARAGDHAVMILVDRSESMGTGSNWAISTSAIVQALDQDSFDPLDVGLYAAPTGTVTGPACVLGLPVPCQTPIFPQVPLTPAGPKSTVGPGGRQSISNWLALNPPAVGTGDAFPLYDVLTEAIFALKAWPGTGSRILIVITDGKINCTSLSNRGGYLDANGCPDWEYPDNLITLLFNAQADVNTPVDTFVIGAPGADSVGGPGLPPYSMRLALSVMAVGGSNHFPPNCTGTIFSQTSGDPTVPCHYDMTVGTFDANTLANVITEVRDLVLPPVAVPFLAESLEGSTPRSAYLAAPVPNPSRSATRLRFGLAHAGPAKLAVHDVTGRLVRSLSNGSLGAGNYSLDWDLRDEAGVPVATGIYFVRLDAGGEARLGKVSVVR